MRCRSCNKILTEYETSIRSIENEEYTDMCTSCISSLDGELNVIGNPTLKHENESISDALDDIYFDINFDNNH
jgi:hypothetical protein